MKSSAKKRIRSQLLCRLKNQKEVDRLKKSFRVKNKLFNSPEFIKAKTILFYLSFGGEVETFRMIDEALALGKKIAVPIINKGNKTLTPSLLSDSDYSLEVGPYGIYQPNARFRCTLPLRSLDLIVVPAVAFDLQGNRLGRGAGYYDRFLASFPRKIPSLGLVFDFQILRKLSCVESHDFSVSKVLYA